MKSLLYFFTGLFIILWWTSCSGDDENELSAFPFTTSCDTIYGNGSLTITSPEQPRVYTNETWINLKEIDKYSETFGTLKINISCERNNSVEERMGIIYILSNSKTLQVIVKQEGARFTISKDTIYNSGSVVITSPQQATINTSESWIKISEEPYSETYGTQTIRINCANNDSEEERTGIISVNVDSKSLQIIVKQNGESNDNGNYNDYPTLIVGTWRMDHTEEYWRFDAAGSGKIGYGENWNKADDVNEGEGNVFQWSFEKNGLMVIYKFSDTFSDPEPDAPYIIRSITSTHMTWTTNNGKGHDESFTKVK